MPVALAGGSYDMGYADLNPAIRFMAENPDRGIVAVAVLHDRSPLCAIVRADGPEERGCQQVFILDLSEGKILGRIHARMDNVQNQ